MTKGTPWTSGPMIFRDNGEANFWKILNDNNWHSIVQQNGEMTDDEQKANLHLWLAAEKMYEELAVLAGHFRCQCGHPQCSIERTRRDIEAVLAEARGESP